MKVFIIAAMSADGLIARNEKHKADWTSPEDKDVFKVLTKRAGVIVMGHNTYKTIGKPLSERRNIVYSRHPIEQEGIEVTQEEPQELVERLGRAGCKEVAICGGQGIYDMFLRAGVVDDLYLTFEPVLFGEGIRLAKSDLDIQLKLRDANKLNADTLLLHYSVLK